MGAGGDRYGYHIDATVSASDPTHRLLYERPASRDESLKFCPVISQFLPTHRRDRGSLSGAFRCS